MTTSKEIATFWSQLLNTCAAVFDAAPQAMGSLVATSIRRLPKLEEPLARRLSNFEMNLLRNRLIGPNLRQFSTNSPAIRSQILENLASNSQFLATVPKVRQPPRRSIELPLEPALQAIKNHPIRPSLDALLPFLPWVFKGASTEGDMLNRAWVELVGSDGVQASGDFRLGLYWQDARVYYPRHRHNADELYYVLAGEAGWLGATGELIMRPPGSYISYTSRQDHATRTYQHPLLALWAWHGDISWASYSVDRAE